MKTAQHRDFDQVVHEDDPRLVRSVANPDPCFARHQRPFLSARAHARGCTSIPGQRIQHSRVALQLPRRLSSASEPVQGASGLSWAELARRLGTYPLTIRRWTDGSTQGALALLDLADALGLSHLLTGQDDGEVPRCYRSSSQESRGLVLAERTN